MWQWGRETIFSCPHTFKFRTRLLTGTTSGMASDCVRCRVCDSGYLCRYNGIYPMYSVTFIRSSEVKRSLMVRWVVGSILHGVDPQLVLHNWCNKGRGMCYPVCGMVHIKEPLLLIDKSSLCGVSGFPFSLSEWSLTICLMPECRSDKTCSHPWTKGLTQVRTSAHDRRALYQLALNVHVKPNWLD